MNPNPAYLAVKLSHLSFPVDYDFTKLTYDMASIAYEVRLLSWESDKDSKSINEITELLEIGYNQITRMKKGYDCIKDKVYIQAINGNPDYRPSLAFLLDSIIYLEEPFDELREEFNL